MNDIQEICLNCYEAFRTICEKHSLRYYAIGGTCIGAIRHRGFIPWDDDIDIAMPYEDWSKLYDYACNELPNEFGIHASLQQNTRINGEIINIYDRNTTFVLKQYRQYTEYYRGIGIDIFPIFGMEKGAEKQQKALYRNTWYLRLDDKLKLSSPSLMTHKSLLGITLWLVCLPTRLFLSNNYWLKRAVNEFSSYPLDNSDKILFGWRRKSYKSDPYKAVFDYRDFANYIVVPFENTEMRLPKGYDNYLKRDFGDYMTVPHKKHRVSNHDFAILDARHPYSYYTSKIRR